MIQFTQILKDNDYRDAGAFYYSLNILMKLHFITGILLVTFGLLLILVSLPLLREGESLYFIVGVAGVPFGVLTLFRKRIYLKKIVTGARSNGNYGKEISVRIGDDGMIELKQGDNISRSDLKTYFGYGVTDKAILLFSQKNQFTILRKDCLGNTGTELLIQQLSASELKRIF
jgi:hypothetical protein